MSNIHFVDSLMTKNVIADIFGSPFHLHDGKSSQCTYCGQLDPCQMMKKKQDIVYLDAAKNEHTSVNTGYNKFLLDPLMGLEKYCGECTWQGVHNCDVSLMILMHTHI